jgi:hypothetical protein
MADDFRQPDKHDLENLAEYDGQENYEYTIEEHVTPGGSREDFGAYLPEPTIIEQRKKELNWLKRQGFGNRFIASVMQFDCPSVKTVKAMIIKRNLSPEEVAKRLRNFLESNEYDNKPLLAVDEDNDYDN